MRCDREIQIFNQKMYDMSSETRSHLRNANTLKSEIQTFMNGLTTRVERVERDVEYLHSKLPDSSSIEISESLLEQQVKEAQTKRQAVVIKQEQGK